MEHKIYIQIDKKLPVADWASSAYYGFKAKKAKIRFFRSINTVPVSPWNIVVGDIESTDTFFQKLGIPSQKALNIPEILLPFAGRKIEYMTMGEFRKDTRVPIFVKPNGRAKSFIGGVLDNLSSKEWMFEGVSDNTECLISEVIELVSEYRGYVINGQLMGIKHYRDDFRIFPDMGTVDMVIKSYENAPSGYTIDFGIDDKGRTLLIECNDGWAIGNYGLDPLLYTKLLATRWLEIMKQNGAYGRKRV